MISARTFSVAALICYLAAWIVPSTVRAASGNTQECEAGSACTVGEFLYNDSYAPITGATCTLTSKTPSGTAHLSSQSMTGNSDGWYQYQFTSPTTSGTYRAQVCCTSGSDYLCLDKSFEVVDSKSLNTTETASAVWDAAKSSYKGSGSFGESLQTAVSSTGDISKAVWGYSDKTLTGFGNLISDIWKNSTQATATPGTVIYEVKQTNQVIQQTQQSLEKLINKPVIESFIEEEGVDLTQKLDNSQKLLNSLITTTNYLKKSDKVGTAVLTDLGSLQKGWGFPSVDKAITAVKAGNQVGLQSALSNIQKDLQHVRDQATALDSQNSELGQILGSWTSANPSEKQTKLAIVNQNLTKVATIKPAKVAKSKLHTDKELKNQALGMQGLIAANIKLLAKSPTRTSLHTWLEEGSVVFKTLATNPSSLVSQTVDLKYYLPPEVKKEHIIKVDEGLEVGLDSEKDQYYVSGKIELGPGASKTVSVTVDSIFEIEQSEIDSLRKQAEQLAQVLNTNTAFFAQGVTLKSDIDASLDRAEILKDDGVTPESKIKAYRQAQVELNAAKGKIEKLKELVTQASSAGNFLGFVGGSQAIAVWGLIIIMAAGFVFLALYMRTLRAAEVVTAKGTKTVAIESSPEEFHHSILTHLFHSLPWKLALVVLVAGGVGVVGANYLRAEPVLSLQGRTLEPAAMVQTEVLGESSQQLSQAQQASPNVPSDSPASSCGWTDLDAQTQGQEIIILASTESPVKVLSKPQADAPVVTTLSSALVVERVGEVGEWVLIKAEFPVSSLSSNLGWVSQDAIVEPEEQAPAGAGPAAAELTKMVTVLNTPTGFLNVRSTPQGEALTQVLPEDVLEVVQEEGSWIQVKLQDGDLGWVAKRYTKTAL